MLTECNWGGWSLSSHFGTRHLKPMWSVAEQQNRVNYEAVESYPKERGARPCTKAIEVETRTKITSEANPL